MIAARRNQIKELTACVEKERNSTTDQEAHAAKAGEYALFFNGRSFGVSAENDLDLLLSLPYCDAVEKLPHYLDDASVGSEPNHKIQISIPTKSKISEICDEWQKLEKTIAPLAKTAITSYENEYGYFIKSMSETMAELKTLSEKQKLSDAELNNEFSYPILDSLLTTTNDFSSKLCLSLGDMIGKYDGITAKTFNPDEYNTTIEFAKQADKALEIADKAISLAQEIRYNTIFPMAKNVMETGQVAGNFRN